MKFPMKSPKNRAKHPFKNPGLSPIMSFWWEGPAWYTIILHLLFKGYPPLQYESTNGKRTSAPPDLRGLRDEHREGDARTAVKPDAPREPTAAGHLSGGPGWREVRGVREKRAVEMNLSMWFWKILMDDFRWFPMILDDFSQLIVWFWYMTMKCISWKRKTPHRKIEHGYADIQDVWIDVCRPRK